MAQPEIVHQFIANVTDIYDTRTLGFIQNGKINIEAILSHNITKLNVIYSCVWKALYGTYPTKKDFIEFLQSVGVQDYNGVQLPSLDANFLNAIISHDAFLILRLTQGPNIMTHFMNDFMAVASNIHDTKFITNVLLEKWQYRFTGVISNKSDTSTHLFKTFVTLYMSAGANASLSLRPSDSGKCKSPVTSFIIPDISLNNEDIHFMKDLEIQQYTIYKDNRFLLQLATSFVVVVNAYDTLPTGLKSIVHKTLKKQLVILYLQDTEDTDASNVARNRFEYVISEAMYHMLPKIASAFMSIGAVYLPLCKNVSHSYLYTSSLGEIEYTGYGKLFVTNPEDVNPPCSIYFFPSLLDEHVCNIIWKYYLTLDCPFKHGHKHNAVLFANFLGLYLHKHRAKMMQNAQSAQDTQGAPIALICIDSRFNYMSVIASLISLYNLQRNHVNAKLHMYTSSDSHAVQQYRDAFRNVLGHDVEVHSLSALDCGLFTMEAYNEVLKNTSFWQDLHAKGYTKCMIVQDDGFLIHGENIQRYLRYDYIGAPWMDVPDNAYIKKHINADLVGNGGFSIRGVNAMLKVTQQYQEPELFYHNINEIPEDVYFVKYLTDDVAPFHVAKNFSIEQVRCDGRTCAGFHKFWAYQPTHVVQQIFQEFLTDA